MLLEVTDDDEKLLASAKPQTPFRIRNILVPIDFSDCSRKALQYALALAKERDASLILLSVVSVHFAIGKPSSIADMQFTNQARAKTRKALHALIQSEVHGEVTAKSLVRVGSPSAEILAAAATLPADIIVIATHGRTGLTQTLLGSVTEHVVRSAPCPVLVVRERERECLVSEQSDATYGSMLPRMKTGTPKSLSKARRERSASASRIRRDSSRPENGHAEGLPR